MLVHTITHHPFKLEEPPNLDKRCKPAWLWCCFLAGDWHWLSRSNSKWNFKTYWLEYRAGLHSRSSPNLQPELDHSCSMLLLFHEPITSNISFAVNYRWTFRLTVDIVIDLFTSEDLYFLWTTVVPLYLQSRWQTGIWHRRDTLSCHLLGFQNTRVPPKQQDRIWDCNQKADT